MFDTERFIAEIERRPAIYDVGCEEYNDRTAKVMAWDQVCEVMTPKWKSLSDEVKNAEEKILRSKWRNIRDYFMKELKVQKLRKGSAASRKRKRYMYYDQLMFLMPNAETKKKPRRMNYATHCKSENSVHHEVKPLDSPVTLLDDRYDTPLSHENASDDCHDPISTDVDIDEEEIQVNGAVGADPYAQFPKSICVTSMTEAFPGKQQQAVSDADGDDYDRMFLLSLLPIMRRLPEDKQLDVRIKMQQVIALGLRNNGASSST